MMTPSPLNCDRAVALIAKHEGFRPTPYRCTANKLTIGYGYNIDARGLAPLSNAIGRQVSLPNLYLTEAEGKKLLRWDVQATDQRLQTHFAVYTCLDEVRRCAVVDFVFNLGFTGAAAFHTTIARLRQATLETDPLVQQVYLEACCFHLMNSLWADQVDDGLRGKYGRADRVCHMLRTGTYSTK